MDIFKLSKNKSGQEGRQFRIFLPLGGEASNTLRIQPRKISSILIFKLIIRGGYAMKIFVVEDEYWALEELKLILKKLADDFELYYYTNGYTAYKDIDRKPDLIITDITMPKMNGIELIKLAKEYNPSIQFILLTVHDTFEYAQKAVKLGVTDYILKPVKPTELLSKVNMVAYDYQKKKKTEEDRKKLRVQRLLMQNILHNKPSKLFDEKRLLVVTLLLGNWDSPLVIDKIKKAEKGKDISKVKGAFTLTTKKNEQVIILPITEKESLDYHGFEEIFQNYSSIHQFHFSLSIKEKNDSLYDIYKKTKENLETQKLFGKPSFIVNERENSDLEIKKIWDVAYILEMNLKKKRYSEVFETVDKLVSVIKVMPITQKQLYKFLLDMYYAFMHKLELTLSDSEDDYFSELNTLVTYDDLEEWINNLMYYFILKLKNKSVAPKQLIPIIVNWIEKSYKENITFQEFADQYHVSLSYLSKEFKEQMNMTFSEYLTNIRIEKAKSFVKSGITQTSRVAELVGFNDVKYFRSVFKKKTGQTFSEYRDSIKR